MATYIDVIQAEIEPNDPLGRGYAGMTPEQVAADMNTAYRSEILESMTGDEVYQQTLSSEFAVLSDHNQLLWMSFCGRTVLDPGAQQNVDLVTHIFGGGSTTVGALNAARTVSITRAQELSKSSGVNIAPVKPGHIAEARR